MSPPVSHDAVGLVVSGRYRLVSHVGTGPSATVYLADDVRLRRRVAVKLLDTALGEQVDFLARFRTEMQVAAELRHPHIGVIHDWGVDRDPFVVGDFHDHGSLADLVDRGVVLDPPQVLQFALAGARALAYAHERDVVHRDVKPSNLLFADDGRLQIVDFGLARAFAEGASTRPMRLGAGDLDHLAPEQVQGGIVDGRADVYSFVLCLIEATTGHRPFAVRGAGGLDPRTGRSPAIPPNLGVLGAVLARASTVDPADRLDAGGLVTALMAVADSYPEAEPLPLRRTRFDGVPEPDDETGLRDITMITAPGTAAAAVDGRVSPGDADEAGTTATDRPVRGDDAAGSDAAGSDSGGIDEAGADDDGPDDAGSDGDRNETDASDGGDRGRRRWSIAWLVLLVVVVVGGGVVSYLVFQAQRTPTHLVPEIDGLTPDAARAGLVELGFDVDNRQVRRDGTTEGELVGVEPVSGTRLAEGETVTLVVSDGRPLVTIPDDLQGMGEDDAVERLEGLDLVVELADERYSEDVDSGLVIGTEPGGGEQLEKGSSVDLVISKGPEPRVVPSVAGMGPGDAEAALADLGLTSQVTERYDIEVDKGGLIGLDPAPGTTVLRGAEVRVIVSKGLLVAVPDLEGVTTVAGAIEKLQAAGLVADALGGSGSLSGKPAAFDPPAGELVPEGSTIDIVVR